MGLTRSTRKRKHRQLNPTKDQEIYRRLRMCEFKNKYATPEEALTGTTQCAYKCVYCDGYHRTKRGGYANTILPQLDKER